MPQVLPPYDKILHVCFFALVTLFGVFSTRNLNLAMTIAASVFIGGLAVEILQSFLPGRSAAVPDVLANGVGVIAAMGVYYLFYRGQNKSPEDIILANAINAYEAEKSRGTPHMACLSAAADSYMASNPVLPEQEVRRRIVNWIEVHSNPA